MSIILSRFFLFSIILPSLAEHPPMSFVEASCAMESLFHSLDRCLRLAGGSGAAPGVAAAACSVRIGDWGIGGGATTLLFLPVATAEKSCPTLVTITHTVLT